MGAIDVKRDDLRLRLRATAAADVPVLFDLQSDTEANRMAGTKARSREAFFATWEKIFADPKVRSRVIEVDGVIVGGVSCFQAEGRDALGYWIAKQHWGRGIASRAVALFLAVETRRPLHATARRTNTRSLRVLEKCGFRLVGYRMGEETERYVGCELAEFVLE
ncbi:MAG TPA: GNAT family N-acetyltransferase [Phycisphaerales bacterium]|nr:GNAT family N-acetyltransferase [Phycisphaerales bacterium]